MLSLLQRSLLFYLAIGQASTRSVTNKQDLNPFALDQYANNSLFLQWRPRYHFLGPAGHMNDPCGPMYDALTDTYHLFYQTFPNHVQGGNGSWGHATSGDLVTWEDVGGWQNDEYLALKPGPYPQYDWIGDWTGNAQPVNLKGEADGNLTAIFTCVHKFPVGWTLPEEPGSEQQCIATSSDGGVTWQKYEHNPIMSLPPSDWNFTRWRDPHFQAMPEIDELLGYDEPHYYMTLGSGINGAGPRMPLYKAKASDLTDWSFMGALFEIPANYSWGGDPFRTGSVGFNIELPGFFSLVEQEEFGGDGETLHYAVNMGTEGGNNTYHPSPRWTMFGLGSVSHRENGSVSLDLDVTAPIDWGVFYAATTFNDTKHNRRVIWGWSDEDMNDYGITAQGFQGALGLPRELFIHKTHNVTAPSDGRLTAQTGNWTETSAGLYTVKTLGSRPLPDVVEALHSSKPVELTGFRVGANQTVALKGLRSQHFHLQASVKVDSSFSSVGFITHATPNMEEHTRITYTLPNSTLSLDRSASSLAPNFTKSTFHGFFQPYTTNGITETLNFDIFVDGSLIEIFINDRFALTSRVYPTRAGAMNIAVTAGEGEVCFDGLRVWTHMKDDIFPKRPTNSSSPLHWDPWYETHVSFEGVEGMPVGTKLYDGY